MEARLSCVSKILKWGDRIFNQIFIPRNSSMIPHITLTWLTLAQKLSIFLENPVSFLFSLSGNKRPRSNRVTLKSILREKKNEKNLIVNFVGKCRRWQITQDHTMIPLFLPKHPLIFSSHRHKSENETKRTERKEKLPTFFFSYVFFPVRKLSFKWQEITRSLCNAARTLYLHCWKILENFRFRSLFLPSP